MRFAVRKLLKRSGWWLPYRRLRDHVEARFTSPPSGDREGHRVRSLQRLYRDHHLARELDGEASVPVARIGEFFDGFRVMDAGIPLVRIGPVGDGGYLVPDDLAGIQECFSPGVDTQIGFDLALANRGITVHMIDASVRGLPVDHPLLDFEPLYLGAETRWQWTSLDDWVSRRSPGTSDLVLEMDIEGHEWAVLLATSPATLRRFRIMVIELHDLHQVTSWPGLAAIEQGFEKLLDDFCIVHVHANNHVFPITYGHYSLHPVVEITLLRKDRARRLAPAGQLTHPLDAPNDPSVVTFPLDSAWL